jgi:tripartite-type tricarboxylate transporter receptor subunit TctC
MHAEVVKALNSPELKETWASNGSETATMSPQDFAKYLNAEIKRWAQVTKASGAKLD